MSAQAFQRFVDLITFDKETHEMSQAIVSGERVLQDLQQQKEAISFQLKNLQETLHDKRKAVDVLELKMKTLEQAEKEKRDALDQATTPVVYRSLKSELEQINAEQLACEQELMAAWNSAESLRKTGAAQEQELTNQHAQLDAAIDQEHRKMEVIDEKLEHREQERAAYISGVPVEWLDEYTRMRSRVSNPVVPVINSSCSACFTAVTSQDMVRLRNKALLSCKGCYRLLYIKE